MGDILVCLQCFTFYSHISSLTQSTDSRRLPVTFWYSLACPHHFASLSLFSYGFCNAALSSSSYLGTQVYKRLKAVLWKMGTYGRFQQGVNCKRGFQSPGPSLKKLTQSKTLSLWPLTSEREVIELSSTVWEFKGWCWAVVLGTWDRFSRRQGWLVRIRV